MCGRYTLTAPDPAEIRARFGIAPPIQIPPRFNVAPGDDVLAVTTDRAGQPRGEMLRWGLVPSWSKTPRAELKMINARVETVARRPAFRSALERFRCLIVADGFYEWQRLPDGRKQAFHIALDGGGLFAFAGLWSIWKGPDQSKLRSCTILTTAANDAIAPLHDRMPIVLAPSAEGRWLDTGTRVDELSELLSGAAGSQTLLRAVGPAVNDARYDGPDCLEPPREEQQGALF